jgi:hypothetical protein
MKKRVFFICFIMVLLFGVPASVLCQPVVIGDLHFEPTNPLYGEEVTLYLNVTNQTLSMNEFLMEIKIDYSVWPYLLWIPVYKSDYIDWFLLGDLYFNISVGYPILSLMPPGRYRFTVTIGEIATGVWDQRTAHYDVSLLTGGIPTEADIDYDTVEDAKVFFRTHFRGIFGNR